jgi:GH15 family glucan-1,4-alpha-glucosidase
MRYDTGSGVDGLPGDEGAFTPCSFWYVHALAVTGEVERARETFEKLLACANHVGLYAEELGVGGEHLGNFPQALTHLALIQCALTLDEALEAIEPERRAG